jgi:hypothetical protein
VFVMKLISVEVCVKIYLFAKYSRERFFIVSVHNDHFESSRRLDFYFLKAV